MQGANCLLQKLVDANTHQILQYTVVAQSEPDGVHADMNLCMQALLHSAV